MTRNLQQLQLSPQKFRDALRIDADGEAVPLGDVLDDWQRTDFEALDPAWQRLAGQDTDGPKRAYLERPRGASKTTDLAVMVAWALFASRRQITGYAAAADKDQARLLRDAIEKLVRLNPWLAKILEVTAYFVSNVHTGSSLEILSADAPSSYGLTPDFVIVDELTHWPKDDLWISLFSAVAKRRDAILVIISNAGYGQDESWQWDVRETARTSDDWYFNRLDRPASWITEKALEEQRRILPDIAYRRLWLNIWTTGSGDALSDGEIQRALTQSGPLSRPEKGWQYVAGLDLGLSRDKAALAVVGKHVGYWREKRRRKRKLPPTQMAMADLGLIDPPDDDPEDVWEEGSNRLKLVRLEVWDPRDSATGKVDLEEIETTIAALDRVFQLQIGCDPWQAAYLIERLGKRGVPVEPVNFVAENLKGMCSAVLESFAESNIDLYNDPQLLQDLHNLRVEERSYGVRLVSPRGTSGHGDSATALAIALNLLRTRGGFTGRPFSGSLLIG
jgi:phage terminase large subunit-like protein